VLKPWVIGFTVGEIRPKYFENEQGLKVTVSVPRHRHEPERAPAYLPHRLQVLPYLAHDFHQAIWGILRRPCIVMGLRQIVLPLKRTLSYSRINPKNRALLPRLLEPL